VSLKKARGEEVAFCWPTARREAANATQSRAQRRPLPSERSTGARIPAPLAVVPAADGVDEDHDGGGRQPSCAENRFAGRTLGGNRLMTAAVRWG
jgi:hypothetical protein